MKTFKCLAALAVMLTALAGCQKEPQTNPGEDPGNEKQSYSITVQESDLYTIDVPDSATEGEEVSLTVTLAENADIEIVAVTYNGEDCDFVSEDGLKSTYSFTMPAEDVAIGVETAVTAFSISWEDTGTYKISGLNPKAKPGDKIEFTISVTDLVYKITEVTYGEGLACAMSGEPQLENDDPVNGPLNYSFSFTMPGNDVTIEVSVDENFFRIYRTSPAHGSIVMKSLIKKGSDGQPETDSSIQNENDRIICEGRHGDKAEFTVEPESDSWTLDRLSIQGKSTGDMYNVSMSGNNVYSFTMPAEEILIVAEMKEVLTDEYEGKDFLGDYSGFWVRSGYSYRSQFYSKSKPAMTYTLNANTTYSITESEDDSYNGTGRYVFNEDDMTFNYNTEAMSDGEIGLSGNYGDELIFVTLSKIGESISYNRSYIALKDVNGSPAITDFISASDDLGYTLLLAFKINGEQKYYIYDQLNGLGYYPVELSFIQGSSITDSGAVADIIKDGTGIYRYSVENDMPVFRTKGSEAGTYEGSVGTLVLDGFGNGTLDGKPGTYTVDGGVSVTFTDSDQNTTEVTINQTDWTYSVNGEWDGPMYYMATADAFGAAGDPITGTITLDLRSPSNLRIDLEYGSQGDISYTYDAAGNTLTIVFIDSWTGQPSPMQQAGGSVPSIESIVFQVSDDKQTIQAVGLDAIYDKYDPAYMPLEGVVLQAQQIL